MNARLLVTASLIPMAAVAAALAPVLLPARPAPPAPAAAPSAAATPAAVAEPAAPAPIRVDTDARIHLEATPDRTVVYRGDRQMRVRLDWWADETAEELAVPTDLTVVLDRSGSMSGDKLADARAAAHALVDQLGPRDRFTLVTFASDVAIAMSPQHPQDNVRGHVEHRAIDAVVASGGTNMVGGLSTALTLPEPPPGYAERIVLVSDGLPDTRDGLAGLAVRAVREETALTAIGIGADYDEALMQSLADNGGGNFYWAQRGQDLHAVLSHELSSARRTVASTVRLRATGARIVDAGGLRVGEGGEIELGSLFGGQRRSVWVTLQLPPGAGDLLDPGALELVAVTPGGLASRAVADLADVTVTDDAKVAFSALGDLWAESVVVDRYNDLRTEVSAAVQRGDQSAALGAIAKYRQDVSVLNAYADNDVVTDNLGQLDQLAVEVQGNFIGENQRQKQNFWAKGTRSDAYGKRRGGSFVPVPAPAPPPSR